MDNLKIIVKNSGIIKPKKVVDSPDGTLVILEELKDVPFSIKRIYYINNFNKIRSVRGKHAHKQLEQLILCINGSFTLTLDDSENKQNIEMKNNNIGIILGPLLWHTMHSFSIDCVILVAASDYYDESDYIRSYDEFLEWHKIEK